MYRALKRLMRLLLVFLLDLIDEDFGGLLSLLVGRLDDGRDSRAGEGSPFGIIETDDAELLRNQITERL